MARRLIAACVAGVAVAAISAPPALAEEPERLGYLVVEPAKGDLLTPIDIATSDVCTRGQMFAVMLDGPNLQGADRGNLIGTTKITTIGPDSYPGHYVVPLPTDLATYIATAAPGQRIKGDYTLTFACRDTLDTADLQVFTATISVDGKGRYAAQGDSATPMISDWARNGRFLVSNIQVVEYCHQSSTGSSEMQATARPWWAARRSTTGWRSR
jgi:hypothetical protein